MDGADQVCPDFIEQGLEARRAGRIEGRALESERRERGELMYRLLEGVWIAIDLERAVGALRVLEVESRAPGTQPLEAVGAQPVVGAHRGVERVGRGRGEELQSPAEVARNGARTQQHR